jgi:hypothetical protein
MRGIGMKQGAITRIRSNIRERATAIVVYLDDGVRELKSFGYPMCQDNDHNTLG